MIFLSYLLNSCAGRLYLYDPCWPFSSLIYVKMNLLAKQRLVLTERENLTQKNGLLLSVTFFLGGGVGKGGKLKPLP